MADLSNLYSGYLKASRYSRIKSADLTRVYKRYGITLADVRKNRRASDASLRRMAIDAVLKRKKLKPVLVAKGPKGGRDESPTGTPSGGIRLF